MRSSSPVHCFLCSRVGGFRVEGEAEEGVVKNEAKMGLRAVVGGSVCFSFFFTNS